MTEERSFLDPLNDSEDLMRVSRNSLLNFASALRFVGNPELADNLTNIANDLTAGMQQLDKGRTMALDRMINGVHQATTNMVNAALAGAEVQRRS
jgi:hypothetical protein